MPRHTRLRTWRSLLPATATSLCLTLTACSARSEDSEKTATGTAAQTTAPAAERAATAVQAPASTRYDLEGKVVAVDKAGKKLTVDHGDIPGLMSALTMPYDVRDAAWLETLSPGDEITAKVSTAGGYHLEDIVVTAKARAK